MKGTMRWGDHIALNLYWLGLNVQTGVITPVLLPYLVALFVPSAVKNTSLATVRVAGLAVAMLVQPAAGMLSDRSLSRWGRRRPFIAAGTIFNVLFLLLLGASPLFHGSEVDAWTRSMLSVSAPYLVLLAAIVLLQLSTNFAQGALLGLIPDLVPEHQRGRSSGVKAVFELLPVFLVILIGPLVDAGRIWSVIGIITAALVLCTLGTVFFVDERPLHQRPRGHAKENLLRLLALTVMFLLVTRGAVWLVGASGRLLAARGIQVEWQVAIVGILGLIGMAGSILLGVYFGARVGIGARAGEHRDFIWWVVNRLLFLAAVGSVQAFAQFFLRDVIRVENAATETTVLLGVVALFLIPSALGGGYMADRMGRKRLVMVSGLLGAFGTFLLLFAKGIPLVIVSGCIIGLGTGTFMATNWALGTDLAPSDEAGRYLGISNLAGAGAGIVGQGIGGPMADFFNQLGSGLGYLVIFGIYAALFLLSVYVLRLVREPGSPSGIA
jgi:MFS family permease